MAVQRPVPLTPWVTRLLVLNWAVFLLLSTVFTAPRFVTALALDPAALSHRPWAVLSYLVVHQSLAQLALTSLTLYLLGPTVERRLGGNRFLAYYVYCGIGAALFALSLSTIYRVEPVIGASGAALGVATAYALNWPDRPVAALELPLTARSLFFGLLGLDLILGATSEAGPTHFVHLGGVVAGYVFFRLQSLTTSRPPARPVTVRQPVVTPMRMQEMPAERRPTAPTALVEPGPDATLDDVDRLLDKISEFGMESLTTEERQALADAAERKRRDQS
ncbi:MAG: rhomboid family intramembrane serine protease [Gemmatimonadales bacterium]